MTSFEFEIDPREEASAEFMSEVHRELVRAAVKAKTETKLTQRKAAESIGMDRSTMSRILKGGGNPTVRTLSDLFFAFGARPRLSVEYPQEAGNHPARLPEIKGMGSVFAPRSKEQRGVYGASN